MTTNDDLHAQIAALCERWAGQARGEASALRHIGVAELADAADIGDQETLRDYRVTLVAGCRHRAIRAGLDCRRRPTRERQRVVYYGAQMDQRAATEMADDLALLLTAE